MLNAIEVLLIDRSFVVFHMNRDKKRVYLAEEQNAIISTSVSIAIVRALGEHISKVNTFSKHVTSYRCFRRSYSQTCLVSHSSSFHYAIENPPRGEGKK